MEESPPTKAPAGWRAAGRGRVLAIALVLLAGTLAVYWPVHSHSFLNYDDPYYVVANPHVQSGLRWRNVAWAFTSMYASNWHPLTWLSHMLDCQCFGQNAGAHHLVNVGLHAANALLLLLLLRRLTGAVWRSAFVAAFFALHPTHVESVAWASERKDVLSTLFFLLTLWAYAEYAERRAKGGRNPNAGGQPQAAPGGKEKGYALRISQPGAPRSALPCYFLALALFALGLMSKPMLVTLPCVLLLLDFWPLGRLRWDTAPRLVWEKAPFFVLSVLSSVATWVAQQQEGAMVSLERLPLDARVENALVSYARYLGKLLWPENLTIIYGHPVHWPTGQVLLSASLLFVVTAGVLWLSRSRPYLLVGWFWFLGTLVPAIGLVQVGIQSMADRYTYIPSIGFCVMVVWGLAELSRSSGAPGTNRLPPNPVLAVTGLLAVVACAGITAWQVHFWQNTETIFGRALQINPRDYRASNNLGLYLFECGRVDEAIESYRRAVKLAPTFGDALDNLGCALAEKQEWAEALKCYRESLRLQPNNPQTHNNIGILLAEQGQLPEACEHFAAAFRLDPHTPGIHSNLGRALAAQGNYPGAIAEYKAALEVWPGDVNARYNLGRVLAQAGKLEEAIGQYQRVLRADAGQCDARNLYGVALAQQGQLAEAMAQFQQVIRAQTNHAGAHNNLAKALRAQQQLPEAVQQYREVLRLRPKDTQARHELAQVLMEAREVDQAIEQYRQLLLGAESAEVHYELGQALCRKAQWEEAAEQFRLTLQLAPNTAAAHDQLAKIARLQSDAAGALAHWREASRLAPEWPEPLNNLAWVLATDPHTEVRNGSEAVRLAERAAQLGGTNDLRFLDTLAAAYAETGRFPEAVATTLKAEAALGERSPGALRESLEHRLALYRAGQPYREAADPK